MKKRTSRKHLPGRTPQQPTTAKTGEHCPLNGWWASVHDKGDRRFISEGSIMPPDKGRSAIWTLITGGPDSGTPDDALLHRGNLH